MEFSGVMGQAAGQSETLVVRLRGLIRDYPSGVGIAREFIQNADDAGATWIRFTLDLRQHNTQALPDARMVGMMGPALLVTSDQSFSDQDLVAIQHIGEGSKRRSAARTGRFGLGFNSVYNLTDYPAFATRDRIVCFDPHLDAVALGDRPGRQWLLKDVWRLAPDWPLSFRLNPDQSVLTETTFRLPLRTPSQVGEGRIGHEPTSPQLVMSIFEELERMGPSLLLFTRHLQRLEAQVVGEDGTSEGVLLVETRNPELVKSSRMAIVSACEGTPADLISTWRGGSGRLPQRVWLHHFRVTGVAGIRNESWFVSSGLYRGGQNELLDMAQAMVDIGEKALPLAGAAALLERVGEDLWLPRMVPGAIYCSLPLPCDSPLPFHINGYFDLDSSRTQIFSDERALGDAQIRYRWNQALLTHAVPPVVAQLFQPMAERLASSAPHRLYDLWPQFERVWDSVLNTLAIPLLHALASGRLLYSRVAYGKEWRSVDDSLLPALSWSEDLRRALVDDGLDLVEPIPPHHVLAGLRRVNRLPQRWTPEMLSGWLRHIPWQDVPVVESPLQGLATAGRVVEILSFVAQQPLFKLEGLPLALRQDGLLCDFRPDLGVYLVSEGMRVILSFRPDLLLDEALERLGVVVADARAGVTTMEVDDLLFFLKDILKVGNQGWLPWNPDGEVPPHRAWLANVLQCLARKEARPFKEKLFELALIPDESGRLWRAGLPSTPFLEQGALSDDEHRALTQFKVPMLEVRGELRLALEALRQTFSGAVPALALAGVVEALVMFEAEGRRIPLNSPDRNTLISWLCQEDRAHPLPDRLLRRLAALPLWPTSAGQVLAADTRGLYLPAEFDPPLASEGMVYVSGGPKGEWVGLLRRLGVRPLELANYVGEQLIPALRMATGEELAGLLRWLKDTKVPELLVHSTDPAEGERVLRKLRQAPIFLGPDGRRYAAAEMYHPGAWLCREVLGETAVMPELSGQEDVPGWHTFFDQLGLYREPRPRDVLTRIRTLAGGVNEENWEEIYPHLLRVMEHLQSRWESIKEVEPGGEQETLAELLRREVWLPTVRVARDLPLSLSTSPLLVRPSDIQRPQFLEICWGVKPVLESAGRSFVSGFLTDLGVCLHPHSDVLLAQLRLVRDGWARGDLKGRGSWLTGWCDLMYGALGRQLSLEGAAPLNLEHDEALVWEPVSARFWPGSWVLGRITPALSGRCLLRSDGGHIGICLDQMGRKKEPDIEVYLNVLTEMALAPAQNRAEAPSVLALFEELALYPGDLRGGRLLTEQGELYPADQVVVENSSYWRARTRGCGIHWLHPGISPQLAGRMGAHLGANILSEVVLGTEESDQEELIQWAGQLQHKLLSPQVKLGLRRLLSSRMESVPELNVTVRGVGYLQTAVTCTTLGWGTPRAAEQVDYCWVGQQFFVASLDPEVVIPGLAQGVGEMCRMRGGGDRAALEQMFRVEPERIEALLDRRGIPSLKTTDGREYKLKRDIETYVPATPEVIAQTEPEGVDDGDVLEQTLGRLFLDDDEPTDEMEEEVSASPPAPTTAQRTPPPAPPAEGDLPQPLDSSAEPAIGSRLLPESELHPTAFLPPVVSTSPPASSGVSPTSEAAHLRGELTVTLMPSGIPVEGTLHTRAVEYALRQDLASGLVVSKVLEEPRFCDLRVEFSPGNEVYWVKVKAIKSAWDRESLYLSRQELKVAEELGSGWRLYVVEFAGSSQQRLFRLDNVVQQLEAYRLDVRWRPVVQANTPMEPDVGLWVRDETGILGQIERVATYGVTRWLTLRTVGGDKKRVMYEVERHQVSEVGDEFQAR